MNSCTLCINLVMKKGIRKINPEKCFTKQAYHKRTGKSRATIDKYIVKGRLDSIKINGGVIIVDNEL